MSGAISVATEPLGAAEPLGTKFHRFFRDLLRVRLRWLLLASTSSSSSTDAVAVLSLSSKFSFLTSFFALTSRTIPFGRPLLWTAWVRWLPVSGGGEDTETQPLFSARVLGETAHIAVDHKEQQAQFPSMLKGLRNMANDNLR